MQDNKLSNRLLWIADRVRKDTFLYDVGTDHAKLPVYLLDNGQITGAVASDIHKGPLEKAKIFVGVSGYNDKIELALADGLSGIEVKAPCDIAICGMGGETIIGIISAAEGVKNSGVRLLLQPMTDFTALRSFFCENGFAIIDEDVVYSDNREYQCIVAQYTGEKYTLTDVEKELGKMCIEKRSAAFLQYVGRRKQSLGVCIEGKKRAELDTSSEDALLYEYNRILEGEQ
ncbi:MAG: SAM-dependent methyltransferase [Clostridia bacterium]|nr:SAM-dependent methyltransferase [Clostridia bacterium]